MGQAFDGDGRMLGEATGPTKADVLAQLERAHPGAAEIRIRSLEANLMSRASIAQILDAAIIGSGERMLPYFKFTHLPEQLQDVSAGFAELACRIVGTQNSTPERTVCLRKLLESKDCAVRNAL